MSRADRKQLLLLACRADRAAWAHACRPRPRPPAQLASYLLTMLAPVTALLPGRIGLWWHGANLAARLSRHLGWLTS